MPLLGLALPLISGVRQRHMEDRTEEHIQKFGWSVVNVFDGDPPFLYTIGLMQTWDHAELIVFGLERDPAHRILSNMVENIRLGVKYTHAETYSDILGGNYKIAVRDVHSSQHSNYLGFAMGHYRELGRSGQLQALQVFWPNKEGKFPFEAECDPETTNLQPRLDLLLLTAEEPFKLDPE